MKNHDPYFFYCMKINFFDFGLDVYDINGLLVGRYLPRNPKTNNRCFHVFNLIKSKYLVNIWSSIAQWYHRCIVNTISWIQNYTITSGVPRFSINEVLELQHVVIRIITCVPISCLNEHIFQQILIFRW